MDLKTRFRIVDEYLKAETPQPEIPLNHSTDFQLLVATILSAQCTDLRVNLTTPALFAALPTAEAVANSSEEEIKSYIKSINFFNNKAKFIFNAAKIIHTKFNDKLPQTMEELLTLPGVARKTASVVLSQWYNIESGFTVDTHVLRLAYFWQLTEQKTPEKVELDLMKLFPQSEWGQTSLRIIYHGRLSCPKGKEDCTLCNSLRRP